MRLSLTISPSFEDGFGIEIQSRRKPSRGNYFVVKTKGLARDSFVRVSAHEMTFDPIVPTWELEDADAVQLETLVTSVTVSPPLGEPCTLDGTLISLSIQRGDNLIAVEWNSEPDERWSGVSELVGFLVQLHSKYRILRDLPDNTPADGR